MQQFAVLILGCFLAQREVGQMHRKDSILSPVFGLDSDK